METELYYRSLWLKTSTTRQLLVNISSNKFQAYLSSGLGADNRSQADRWRQDRHDFHKTFNFYFIKNA